MVMLAKILLLAVICAPVFAEQAQVKMDIENPSDKALWIEVYVDGSYRGGEYVGANSTLYYLTFYLDAGSHTLGIEWKEDACEKYSRSEDLILAADERVSRTLTANKSAAECKVAKAQNQPSQGAGGSTLRVYVTNEDDDELNLVLYVNDVIRMQRYAAPNATLFFDNLYLSTGVAHELKLAWRDPDAPGEWQEKTQNITLLSGETAVTLVAERKVVSSYFVVPVGNLSVIIKNPDEDNLWVDFYLVDRMDKFTRTELVLSNFTQYFGTYTVAAGWHNVTLRWIDPDVFGWLEKSELVYVEAGKELWATFEVNRNEPESRYRGFLRDL